MSLLKKGFGRAILKLKFSYDKPNLYIPTCILNVTPGQKFETWVSSPYHLESKRCKCSSSCIHRRHLGLQDFSAYCSLLTHMKLKCISDRPCVSLKCSNLILIHLASPGYTGKRHANPQVEMSEVYFYIVVINFAFKAKQIMYKVWLAFVPTYGQIDNPYRYARVAEPWGNRKWSVTWIFLNIQISAIK